MISDEDSDDSCCTSETGDATTITSSTCGGYDNSGDDRIGLTSPGVTVKGRERRRCRTALQPAETEMLKSIDSENAYQFMARCVAYPISRPLFNKRLLTPKDTRIGTQDLREIAEKCEQYLKQKDLKPFASYNFNIQSYVERVYKVKNIQIDPNIETDEVDDIQIEDRIVLWLYCQVSPEGAAYKLLIDLKDDLTGRLNGFKMKFISSIMRTYTEKVWKKEYRSDRHKKVQTVNEVVQNIEAIIFRDLVLTKQCARELTPDYYYELLQKLLKIDSQRHKMIYNQNKLDNKEAQIVRLREEAGDRDSMMLLNMRRSSVQYTSDSEATRALEEQKQSLKLFKENINSGERGSLGSSHLYIRSDHRVRLPSNNAQDTNFNDFKINFIVGRVICPKLTKNVNYLCTVKCSGCNKRFRSEFKIVKDGVLDFDCQFKFTTKHPSPIIKIKLKEHQDGIFKDSKVLIGTKAMKLNIKFTDIKTGMHGHRKREELKVINPEEDGPIDIEYKYDITFENSIKMIGHLKVTGGFWGDKKSFNFFILYIMDQTESDSEEENGLQEVGPKGELLKCINQLTDYDVIQAFTGSQYFEDHDDPYKYGFTLLMEGEEISFYSKSEDEKNKWVHQIFMLTKQTFQTDDRSRTNSVKSPTDKDTNKMAQITDNKQRRMWPTSDITANQGKHGNYFREVLNKMVDLNLGKERPMLNGALHPAHEALLLEYKHRYDISDGVYCTTMLECLTRKCEEGYFVEPCLLQQKLIETRECLLRKDLVQIRDQAVERLFENMQCGLRFIFLKFPYNMGETQLFAYGLLFNDLAKDLKRTDEIGQLDVIMMNALERSMEFEYETHIAPSHLINEDIEKFAFNPMDSEERENTLETLEIITSRCIMFMENFVIFYAESLSKYGIQEKDLKQLAETFFRIYSVDLIRLIAFITTDPENISETFTPIFKLFKTLNLFCKETTYLTFGQFHTVLLHNAFILHVLTFVEAMSNKIISESDREFVAEDWTPIDTVHLTVRYSCKCVWRLKDRLDKFMKEIEALEWPNPDFKQVLDDMMQQKHQQILMKYGYLIKRDIEDQIRENGTEKIIPDLTLKTLNCLVSLYPHTPDTLDPANDVFKLDQVVLDCIKIICGPILNYQQKVLADWDDSVIVTICNLVGSKASIQRARDFIWYLEFDCIKESLKREINPEFIDTLLLEIYKCIISDISNWLNNKKRFYRTQIVVLTTFVDKIRDIFYLSRRYTGIRLGHDNNSYPEELKTQEYETITCILNAEDLKLIGRGETITSTLQDIVKSIINEPNPNL